MPRNRIGANHYARSIFDAHPKPGDVITETGLERRLSDRTSLAFSVGMTVT